MRVLFEFFKTLIKLLTRGNKIVNRFTISDGANVPKINKLKTKNRLTYLHLNIFTHIF